MKVVPKIEVMSTNLRKAVIIVALLNLAYFGIEFGVAAVIGSVSLFADSIDFLEDTSLNFVETMALISTNLWRGIKEIQPPQWFNALRPYPRKQAVKLLLVMIARPV